MRCLVMGVGKMGLAHLQALAALGGGELAGWAPSERRRASVESTGAVFLKGNLDDILKGFAPTHVVIATPVETLVPMALCVLNAGVRHILLEKPAALTGAGAQQLLAESAVRHATIYVGYNRRFYGSVRAARSMMDAAGEKIESVLFEFNEVVADAGPLGHDEQVQRRWLLANSMHVIDTAFFPVGLPDVKRSMFARSGSLVWHPSGRIFAGAGETELGVPFAYHANWDAPGRWGFEWMTRSTRYVFRPMEKLSVMRKGRFDLEPMVLEDEMDIRFKPGVYHQNAAFLAGDRMAGLVTLAEAAALIPMGQKIAGYPEE